MIRQIFYNLIAAAMIAGCATIPADFVQPAVTVVSVTPSDWRNFNPDFEVVLRVTNPNRKPLQVDGLTYTIQLDGNKVIDGVASELPKIAAYSENEVTLRATADLFGGLNLLAGLLSAPSDQIEYEFNAQIDIGAFYPMIEINKTGKISLQ